MSTPPPVRLRECLAEARRAEVSFEEAWPSALVAALAGQPKWEVADWTPAFRATLDVWRDAYTGSGEDTVFAAVFADQQMGNGGRMCGRSTCSKSLPPDTHGNVLYCSAECRRAVHREREASSAMAA